MAHPSVFSDNLEMEHISLEVEAQIQKRVNVVCTCTQAAGRFPSSGLLVLVGYVSDSPSGNDITSTPPTTVKIKGEGRGTLTKHVTDKLFTIVMDDNGKADIEFFDSDSGTWYLHLIMPNGKRLDSAVIVIV